MIMATTTHTLKRITKRLQFHIVSIWNPELKKIRKIARVMNSKRYLKAPPENKAEILKQMMNEKTLPPLE